MAGVTSAPEPLRDVIARHGLQASKALGQNFILDRQLLARIAAIPGPLEGQTVYEVGPGPGGLTQRLARRRRECGRGRARPPLPARPRRAGGGITPEQLRVIEGDALQIDERAEAGDGAHVVANLPYNVGTALLLRWLERAVAALVAIADPDVPARGRRADRRRARQRSITAGCRSLPSGDPTPRIAMKVHRSAFVPPPKVTSAVVHIVPRADAGRRRLRPYSSGSPRPRSASAARCCGRA